MQGNDRRTTLPFMPKNEVTALLTLLDETHSLESGHNLRWPDRRQAGQAISGLRT